MNIREFQIMLQPARKRWDHLRFIAAVVKTTNCLLIVLLSVSLAAILHNIAVAAFTGFQLSIIMLSALCIHGLWLGWKFSRRSEFALVAQKLDDISNHHNMISAAFEFVLSGRDSEFAEYAIDKGTEMLESISLDKLKVPHPPFKTVILSVACLAMITSFMTLPAGVADSRSASQMDQLMKVLHATKPVLLPDSIEGVFEKKTDIGPNKISSVGFHEPGEQSDINVTEQAASAMSKSARTVLKKTTLSGRTNKVNAAQNEASDDNFSKVTLSSLGTAATPPAETGVKVDFLNINAGLDEDQLNVKIKEKDAKKSLSSSGRRPFSDDRRSAPGRELGRSGKKGKPGSGRGGLGSVKKSRSTAALFPGQMMTVHVPSKPSKGKSKSFESSSPLRTGKDAVETSLANNQSREGLVDIYPVKDSFASITKRYFEELNTHANKMLRKSSEED